MLIFVNVTRADGMESILQCTNTTKAPSSDHLVIYCGLFVIAADFIWFIFLINKLCMISKCIEVYEESCHSVK